MSRLLVWSLLLMIVPCGAKAQTLQLNAINDTTEQVEVFGDGNVKGTVGQSDQATAAAGSLGMRYRDGTFVVTGSINVAGTNTTATKSFGATLLSPATGGPLNAGLIDVRMPRLVSVNNCKPSKDRTGKIKSRKVAKVLCTFGLHVYGSAATTRWATAQTTDGAVTDSADVPFWGFGAGPSVTFFSGTIGEAGHQKPVSMVLDVGLVSRHLRGDLYSQDAIRQSLLGTTKKDFYGLELGLGLQYDNLRAGFSYYFLNGDVPGLSHGQVVAGVSIQANLVGGTVASTLPSEDADDTGDADLPDAPSEQPEDAPSPTP